MSPGKRPNQLGAKPLHKIAPSTTMTAPITTRNFPSSRITDKVARIGRRHKVEAHGSAVQRLLRNARCFQNGDGGRDQERVSEIGQEISSGRRQGQKSRRGKI